MARQFFAKTICGFCNETIKLATEDIGCELISDCGENEKEPDFHDFNIGRK